MSQATRLTLISTFVLGFAYVATNNSVAVEQGEFMECSPPKFMLVGGVDPEAGRLVGMMTIERSTPDPVVSSYSVSFKLTDITITNARRKPVAMDAIKELEGKLVVVCDGATPLSAAYLSLFQEGTLVITKR